MSRARNPSGVRSRRSAYTWIELVVVLVVLAVLLAILIPGIQMHGRRRGGRLARATS